MRTWVNTTRPKMRELRGSSDVPLTAEDRAKVAVRDAAKPDCIHPHLNGGRVQRPVGVFNTARGARHAAHSHER